MFEMPLYGFVFCCLGSVGSVQTPQTADEQSCSQNGKVPSCPGKRLEQVQFAKQAVFGLHESESKGPSLSLCLVGAPMPIWRQGRMMSYSFSSHLMCTEMLSARAY